MLAASGSLVGLDALVMLKKRPYLVFVIASILACIPLTFYFSFTNAYLNELHVPNAAGKMALGQASEVVMMLLMPFIFRRITVPLLGGDGWVSDRLLEIAQDALNGSYFVNHYWVEDPNPAIQKFVTEYRARYNATPDGLAALGYDAAGVLTSALERLRQEDPAGFKALCGPRSDKQKPARAKLRDMIASTKDFPGVTGRISLDASRNAVKPAVFLGIENRAYKYVAAVEP